MLINRCILLSALQTSLFPKIQTLNHTNQGLRLPASDDRLVLLFPLLVISNPGLFNLRNFPDQSFRFFLRHRLSDLYCGRIHRHIDFLPGMIRRNQQIIQAILIRLWQIQMQNILHTAHTRRWLYHIITDLKHILPPSDTSVLIISKIYFYFKSTSAQKCSSGFLCRMPIRKNRPVCPGRFFLSTHLYSTSLKTL